MKNKRMMALALASVLTVSALGSSALAAAFGQGSSEETIVQETVKNRRHGRRGEKSSVVEPENAIGKDAAKEKALSDAGITAEQAGKVMARIARDDDGAVIYKVRFTYNGQCRHYQINAVTGVILDTSTEAAAEYADRKDGQGRHNYRQDTASATA